MVEIYFHVRKKLFSVRHRGKVIAHVKEAFMRNADFVVSQAGRRRVLRNKRKHVHAIVRGHLAHSSKGKESFSIFYNPYKVSHFTESLTGKAIDKAKEVHFRMVGTYPTVTITKKEKTNEE